jgi:hypothetical protein
MAGLNAMNIGAAGVELLHLVPVNVKAGDAEAFFAEQQRQRQSGIAKPDDAYHKLTPLCAL